MNIQDIYHPILTHFRRKRLKKFYENFQINDSKKLLDVGGDLFFWDLAKREGFPVPKITIINIYPADNPLPENITWMVTDGKSFPFEYFSFDLAFCNSVIEHLETWESQIEFANEIRRISANYFVQTPSKAFFFEPHLLAPFIHWLPKEVQKPLIRNFTGWGLIVRPTQEECERYLQELRLLNRDEMSQLFPDAVINREKSLGWEKSLIAIRKVEKSND
jgi:hypothetical protein